MKKKRLALGVTGGIAAYKTADLARLLVKSDFEVIVIMTNAATKFVAPLTLEVLTGNKVITSVFSGSGFKHLEIANYIDLLVAAPSTANFIAKASRGIADDALSTIFLAASCPKIIAPAMNNRMYENNITRENIDVLKKQGVVFVDPEKGELACGDEGVGRLAKLEKIVDACLKQATSNKQQEKGINNRFSGKRFLVTAGGTREKIDAVRCITNLSSGKTGLAIAKELHSRGADVTLVTSNRQETVEEIKTLIYENYNDLKKLLDKNFPKTDCLIMCAAVSDFKPKNKCKEKLKREEALNLELVATGDLLGGLTKNKNGKLVVGFAAETKDIEKNAFKKLKMKNLDLIIANDVSKKDSGIGKDYCDFTVIYSDGKRRNLGRQLKTGCAREIADILAGLLN